jgi:hypothetical protein
MKKEHSNLAEDFAFFESLSTEKPPASESVEESHALRTAAGPKTSWAKAITKDLVRSPLEMAALYTGLSIVGYVASLAVCAQNSFGLGSLSRRVADILHQLPDPWCPIVCGSVFALVPFVISSVVLNRFQQRYLMTRMWWFFASIPIAAAGLMLLLPHSLQHARMNAALSPSQVRPDLLSDGAWMAIWVATAVLLPYLLQAVVYVTLMPRGRSVAVD